MSFISTVEATRVGYFIGVDVYFLADVSNVVEQ